jgi:TatA/E family protein of Tat protein translocase
MFSIPHLIVIFIVALVIFGPEKLPELARNLGKVMAEFRRHTNELRYTFESHMRDIERDAEARKIAPPPAVSGEIAAASPPGTIPSNPPNAMSLMLEGAPIPGVDEPKPTENSGEVKSSEADAPASSLPDPAGPETGPHSSQQSGSDHVIN